MPTTDTEKQLRDYFSTRPPDSVAVYLCGSEGRGTAGPDSDVDLAVLYAKRPPSTLDSLHLALEADLERLLGRSIEVVVLNTASADLAHRVLRDGRLLFEGDRSARGRDGRGIAGADTRLDRDVAIKVIPERLAQDPTALSRFEREAHPYPHHAGREVQFCERCRAETKSYEF